MFAVIRHTYIITKDKPDKESSNEYTGTWKHYAFLCMNEAEAMVVAVHLLHDPLLSVSDFVFDNAIKQLEDSGYYQVGGESVAIAEIMNSDETKDRFNLGEIDDTKESLH